MEYDDDDLPDGFTNMWGIIVARLRDWQQKGRGVKRHTRPVVNDDATRTAAELRRQKFYLSIGPTADWRENRKLYNRKKDLRITGTKLRRGLGRANSR